MIVAPTQTVPAVPFLELEGTNPGVGLVPARTVHVVREAQVAVVLIHAATTKAQEMGSTNPAVVSDQVIENKHPEIAPLPIRIALASTAQEIKKIIPAVVPTSTG